MAMQIPVHMTSIVSTTVTVDIPDEKYTEMVADERAADLRTILVNEASQLAPRIAYADAEFDAIEKWEAVAYTAPDGHDVEMPDSFVASSRRHYDASIQQRSALLRIQHILNTSELSCEYRASLVKRILDETL